MPAHRPDPGSGSSPDIFVIGISGAVGTRLAGRLLADGVRVRGLVRTPEQRAEQEAAGAGATVGDLATMSVAELADALGGSTAIVYAAGSNGGAWEVTDAIDAEGVAKAVAAAGTARVPRIVLLSVMPEAWRERDLSAEEEHYFATKKQVEVLLTHSELDWVVLRPSLLLDDPGTGLVSLGPVELHRGIPRDDVAHTLAEVLLEPRITRQVLELDQGSTPVAEAVEHLTGR